MTCLFLWTQNQSWSTSHSLDSCNEKHGVRCYAIMWCQSLMHHEVFHAGKILHINEIFSLTPQLKKKKTASNIFFFYTLYNYVFSMGSFISWLICFRKAKSFQGTYSKKQREITSKICPDHYLWMVCKITNRSRALLDVLLIPSMDTCIGLSRLYGFEIILIKLLHGNLLFFHIWF